MILRDAREAARAAKLRYVAVDDPGYVRRRAGKGFVYVGPDGRVLRRADELARIASLAIPPAWTEVWICTFANGHIQATGIDARGRKQYRYHPRWREVRDGAKFEDAVMFAEALPRLRARIDDDLAAPKLGKDKVLAAVVAIMDKTRIRVGNDRYAAANDSYGVSTLLDQHARISGPRIELRFRGKGGKNHVVMLEDPRLAKIVKKCRDVPGQRLFQWIGEDGTAHAVTSTDVNRYIRRATGHPFTAKEVRTWGGTVGAAIILYETGPASSPTDAKRRVNASIRRVAEALGNTLAICKRCYVHPAVLTAFEGGRLHAPMERALANARANPREGLLIEESAVLVFLAAA